MFDWFLVTMFAFIGFFLFYFVKVLRENIRLDREIQAYAKIVNIDYFERWKDEPVVPCVVCTKSIVRIHSVITQEGFKHVECHI